MKYIISALILILSFVFSGVLVIYDIDDYTNISFWYWILIFLVVNTALFKVIFKNEKRFKYKLFRGIIRVNRLFKKVDKVYYYTPSDSMSVMQEKSIKLWNLCLTDSTSKLSYSNSKQIRQIEKDNMMLILSPSGIGESKMIIMDTSSAKSYYYEIKLPDRLSENIILTFDTENESRVLLSEKRKSSLIQDDLDKLIKQEEQSIKLLKKSRS